MGEIIEKPTFVEREIAIKSKHKEISEKKTPKTQIKKRPDGLDYLEEGYMRQAGLNENYPIWSWTPTDNPVQFLGSEWVVVSGVLEVVDEGVPRKFFSPGAARVQFKRGAPHTPENVIDIDKNVASANTNAFKRAINRLTNFGDDVYRKQVEDLELNDKDREKLRVVINDLSEETLSLIAKELGSDIEDSLFNGEINKSNIDTTLRYLKRKLEKQGD